MNIDRKELKTKAKGTIKKHYVMFVLGLLLCAMLGIDYTYSTTAFTMLNGENREQAKDDINAITDGAYINAEGDIVYNSSLAESGNEAANTLYDLFMQYFSNSRQGKIVDTAINGPSDETLPDSTYAGIISVSYQKGALASLFNSLSTGSYLLTMFNSISKVIKNPSVTTILVLILSALLLLAYRIFILNAVWITNKRIFMVAQTYTKSNPKTFLFLLKGKIFFKACIAYFVKQIYQVLWNLTIVGGIIKHFSYVLVPYIIAENPNLKPNEAITLSRKMMKGHKWELFVYSLTFAGWEILNIITLGLLGLFFLNPYIESFKAGYYLALREEAINNKVEGYELLNDVYLTHVPTKEEMEPVYGQMIADAKQRIETEEKVQYTGFRKILANWFGIVLKYDDKAKKMDRQEEDEELIQRYYLILEGKYYPNRLHPSSKKGDKTPRYQSLHFLKRYSIASIVALFFIGCFIGWAYEVGIHLVKDGVFVNRGVMHGPWLPIYGTGAAVILVILYKFRDKAWLEFLLTIVLCGCVEYFASWLMETTHNGQKWWDYTGYFLNINGRICAEGLLVFGVAGMVFVYLAAPLLDKQLQKIPLRVLAPILAVLVAIFIADNIYSHYHPNTGKGITDYGEEASSDGNTTQSNTTDSNTSKNNTTKNNSTGSDTSNGGTAKSDVTDNNAAKGTVSNGEASSGNTAESGITDGTAEQIDKKAAKEKAAGIDDNEGAAGRSRTTEENGMPVKERAAY